MGTRAIKIAKRLRPYGRNAYFGWERDLNEAFWVPTLYPNYIDWLEKGAEQGISDPDPMTISLRLVGKRGMIRHPNASDAGNHRKKAAYLLFKKSLYPGRYCT